MRKFLKLFFLIALLSGCSLYQITSDETSLDYYPPKSSGDQVLYLKEVPHPYKVIGSVVINAERNQKQEKIIEKLKREAAVMGGDAITNISPIDGEDASKNKLTQILRNARLRQSYRADVVVFDPSTSRTPAPQNP